MMDLEGTIFVIILFCNYHEYGLLPFLLEIKFLGRVEVLEMASVIFYLSVITGLPGGAGFIKGQHIGHKDDMSLGKDWGELLLCHFDWLKFEAERFIAP